MNERLNRKELKERREESFDSLRTLCSLWLIILFAFAAIPASAQIQQAWVAKYNNGIPSGNHQALKMTVDASGNIYVLGVSANASTNTGYVVLKYAPNGNQVWAARYDSINYPTASPTGFALDSSNNVVVTGNAVTVKFNANGNLLWTAPYNASAIAADPGQNVCITGVSSNFLTMKFSPAGSNIWSMTWTYQGLPNEGQIITVDDSSNVYVAGLETENIPRTPYQNVGLLKYDLNGNQLWANSFDQGDFGGPTVVGLLVDGSGNVYAEFNFAAGLGGVTAYQTSKINPNGTVAWNDSNPTGNVASMSQAMALDKNDNVFITGKSVWNAQTGASSYGTYKLDTNGNYLWSNLYPSDGSTASIGLALVTVATGGVIVTGISTNGMTGAKIVTIRYDSDGNQVWLQQYGSPGPGNAGGNAIAVDNASNVYVAGYETETNGSTEMVLIKYSPVMLQKQPNGSVILHAYGAPGESFDLQASTNLQTWEDLGDVIADTNGVAQFDDTNAPLFNCRFYYTVPQ
jgi:hypothetical protein